MSNFSKTCGNAGGATSITFGCGHFASRRDLALMADIIERMNMKESGRRWAPVWKAAVAGRPETGVYFPQW
jgi:hypothetical protein